MRTKIFAVIFILIITTSSLLTAGCENKYESNKKTKAAIENIKKGEYGKATGQIDEAIKQYRKNALALSVKAFLNAKNGDGGSAKRIIRQAVMLDKTNWQIRLNSAKVFLFSGDTERALEEAGRALELSQDSPEVKCFKAEILSQKNEPAEAAALLTSVIQGGQNSDLAAVTLGDIFFKDKNFEKALEQYDLALAKNPANIEAIASKALVLIEKGKMKEAFELIKHYDESGTDNPKIHLAMAKISKANKNRVKEEEELTKAIANDKFNRESYLMLAMLKMEQGNAGEAERNLFRILEIDPNNGEALYYRAYIKLSMGQTDEGRQLLEQAIKADPSFSLSYTLKSNILLKEGKLEEALDLLKKSEQLDAEHPFTQTYLARAYIIKRDAGLAEKHADKAIQKDPSNILALYYKASALAMQNKKDQAFSFLEKAFENGFNESAKLNTDFCWQPYREDPKFKEFLKKAR